MVTVFPPHAVPPSSFEPLGENAGIRLLLPVGRSFWAIAAGYAGLFAVLLVPAPIALILAIIAIYDIKRHPKRHGMGRAIFGLVMGIIFTIGLILAIVGCVAAGFQSGAHHR
jgi:amino acid permease